MPGISAYSAAKGALERWAESLSQEIAPFGLGVTVLVAGTFKTDILELTTTYADPDGPYADLHAGSSAPATTSCASRLRRNGSHAGSRGRWRTPAPFARHTVGPDARAVLVGSRSCRPGLFQRVIGLALAPAPAGQPSRRRDADRRPRPIARGPTSASR